MEKRGNQQSVDLKYHIRKGAENLVNSLDKEKDFFPIFYYWLLKEPPYGQHSEWDIPNQLSRTIDALLLAESTAKIYLDPKIEEVLIRLFFGSFSKEDNLPWRPSVPASYRWYVSRAPKTGLTPPHVSPHDLKDALLALNDIIVFKKAKYPESKGMAREFCRGIDGMLSESGGFRRVFWPTQASGRLTMALVEYCKVTEDRHVLKLARKFADHNLEQCFTEEGELTDKAGEHVHSITGTIASIINFGILADNPYYIERGRSIYDVGMAPLRSSFGWVKENVSRNVDEGEICCTADMIEASLLLGSVGHHQYFEDAERMTRNHLIESQLLDTSWIKQPVNLPDQDGKVYNRILECVEGSFAGWCRPNDFSSGRMPEVQMCCSAHAVHALCKVLEKTVTTNDSESRINLLFSKSSSMLKVKSWLPTKGRIDIHLHSPTVLKVRIPSWVKEDEMIIETTDKKVSREVEGHYISFSKMKAGSKVKIMFPQEKVTKQEIINGKTYTVEWLGDTVKSISPRGELVPLYEKRK